MKSITIKTDEKLMPMIKSISNDNLACGIDMYVYFNIVESIDIPICNSVANVRDGIIKGKLR